VQSHPQLLKLLLFGLRILTVCHLSLNYALHSLLEISGLDAGQFKIAFEDAQRQNALIAPSPATAEETQMQKPKTEGPFTSETTTEPAEPDSTNQPAAEEEDSKKEEETVDEDATKEA
jgi:hypothetical protein